MNNKTEPHVRGHDHRQAHRQAGRRTKTGGQMHRQTNTQTAADINDLPTDSFWGYRVSNTNKKRQREREKKFFPPINSE